MKGLLFLRKIGEEFNLTYEFNEVNNVIGATSNPTPMQYKLSKDNCNKLLKNESEKIEVQIKTYQRLNLNTGRFDWDNQEDSEGCIILEKL